MAGYVARRVAQAALVLWLLTLAVFLIARLSGNPVDLLLPEGATPEQRRGLVEDLGLDRSLPQQYREFLLGALHGDFGTSIRFQAPAMELVLERLPASAQLAAAALALAILLGIPLGTLAALARGRIGDPAVSTLLTFGQAVPSFWLGVLLISVFGVSLGWLPIAGKAGLSSFVLPSLTLSVVPLVTLARLTRSSVLGVLPNDYVRTGRAKGLRRLTIVRRYVLRNALVPVVTVAGILLAELISGAVITEQIFAWPGVGRLAVESINARDFPVVQAVTLVSATFVVAITLLVDLLYVLLDPRIRVGKAPPA